ncbi:hypothetical protein SVAN01_11978, partial [Stagonosporopsis vannaccii]
MRRVWLRLLAEGAGAVEVEVEVSVEVEVEVEVNAKVEVEVNVKGRGSRVAGRCARLCFGCYHGSDADRHRRATGAMHGRAQTVAGSQARRLAAPWPAAAGGALAAAGPARLARRAGGVAWAGPVARRRERAG